MVQIIYHVFQANLSVDFFRFKSLSINLKNKLT